MSVISIALILIFAILGLVDTSLEKEKNAHGIHNAKMMTAFLILAANKVEEKGVIGILTATIITTAF